MIIIPRKHINRPGGARSLVADSKWAANCIGCVVSEPGSPIAIVGGTSGITPESLGIVGPNGEFFRRASASTSNWTLSCTESPSYAVEYSILSVVSPGSLVTGGFYNPGPFSPLNISIDTGPVLQTRVRVNDGTYYYATLDVPPVAGEVYNCVASVSFLTKVLTLHVNGRESITSLSSATGWYSTGRPSQNITQIGYGGLSTNRRVALLSASLVHDLELNRELSINPWQLFRADPVRIYSLPSGPISVTLNSLTASNITQTGARITLGLTR